MSKELGSYNYSSFEKESTELARLKKQASMASQLERRGLIRHGLKKGMTALDLGCGPGFTTRMIASITENANTVGMDLNPDLLKVAQSENQSKPIINLNFVQGNAYDLSGLKQKFDFVCSRFVFQHLEHPHKALEQILSVLNPGGIFLAVDVDDSLVTLFPKHETFEKIFNLQQRYQASQGGDRFIGRKLPHLMTSAGFTEIHTHVETVTSELLGIDNFLELTTGYKLIFLNESKDKDTYVSKESVESMRQDCLSDHHSGTVGVFNVSGKKQS